MVIVVFLLGRRSGKKKTTFVEIRQGVTWRNAAPSYLSPTAFLVRSAMRKGLFGDSRLWKAVGIFILARRGLRKVMGSEVRTVAVEPIRPGETVILRGITSRDMRAS